MHTHSKRQYESERRQYAQKLIDFDKKFAKLFSGKPPTEVSDELGVSHEEFMRYIYPSLYYIGILLHIHKSVQDIWAVHEWNWCALRCISHRFYTTSRARATHHDRRAYAAGSDPQSSRFSAYEYSRHSSLRYQIQTSTVHRTER